jgi:hypothetical protein
MAEVEYSTQLPAWQKFLISLVVVVIGVVAVIVAISPNFQNIGLTVLGLFIQIGGFLLLALGLVKTNDDLLYVAEHPKRKDHQGIITHMASERFQVMLGLFLVVLGLLLQLFGTVM